MRSSNYTLSNLLINLVLIATLTINNCSAWLPAHNQPTNNTPTKRTKSSSTTTSSSTTCASAYQLKETLSSRRKSTTQMSASSNMIDVANFALDNSPASTRFITNKMCPFAQKVWIALEVLEIPYELKEVSLYGSNGKPDWFWELNPDGTVPVVVANGGAVILPDSELVLEFIDAGQLTNTEKKTIIINDETIKDKVTAFRKNLLSKKLLPIGKSAVQSSAKQKMKALHEVLQEIEDEIIVSSEDEDTYLFGTKLPTTADCAAFPFLWRLNDNFDISQYSKIQKWLQTCNNNKAFAKTVQSSWWWWW